MVTKKNKDYVLGVLSRKGCSQEKGVPLLDAKMHLNDWDKDSFWSTFEALTDEKLIWTNWGTAFFTPKGCRRAENLLDPATVFSQNSADVGTCINSPVQQGFAHADMTQTVACTQQNPDDLKHLVDTFEKHIDELVIGVAVRRKALAQVATIKAQLEDEPDPVIIKEAGRTLRNLTEGAVGGFIARAEQPTVWHWVQLFMMIFQ